MKNSMDELEKLNDALRELLAKVRESQSIALQSRNSLGELIHSSHLRSTLTMLKEDIVLKRMLNLY